MILLCNSFREMNYSLKTKKGISWGVPMISANLLHKKNNENEWFINRSTLYVITDLGKVNYVVESAYRIKALFINNCVSQY